MSRKAERDLVDLRWTAYGIIERYVKERVKERLATTEELDPYIKYDQHLPPGHSINRPSLKDDEGVRIFWGDPLLHLRRFFAPSGDIAALLRELTRVARSGRYLPNDCELFAVDVGDFGMFKYEGDGRAYTVSARYKKRNNK